MHAVKLLRPLDEEALLADLHAIDTTMRSVPAGYPGEGHIGWKVVCLFTSISGFSEVLDRAPYIKRAILALDLQLHLIRLMVLEPGGVIQKHTDSFLSNDIARLHVPIITNPGVEFYIDGRRCHWNPGELWYGDFSRPHWGMNRGNDPRVHMVLDVEVDDSLRRLFPNGQLPDILSNGVSHISRDIAARTSLDRLAAHFTLPRGFSIPGTNYACLEVDTDASVELLGKEIWVCVNGQPMLKGMPVAEDLVEILGLGSPLYLHYNFQDGKLHGMILSFDPNNHLPLAVRVV